MLVQLLRQPVVAFSAPLLLLASSNSTVTVPVKVVSTAVRAVFSATTASENAVPAILVLITPVIAPLAVEVSNALKPPGIEARLVPGRRSSAFAAPLSATGGLESVAVFVPVAPVPVKASVLISSDRPRSSGAVSAVGAVKVPDESAACVVTSIVLLTPPALTLGAGWLWLAALV